MVPAGPPPTPGWSGVAHEEEMERHCLPGDSVIGFSIQSALHASLLLVVSVLLYPRKPLGRQQVNTSVLYTYKPLLPLLGKRVFLLLRQCGRRWRSVMEREEEEEEEEGWLGKKTESQ